MRKFRRWTPIVLGVLFAMPVAYSMAAESTAASKQQAIYQSTDQLNRLINQAVSSDFKRASIEHQSQSMREQGIADATLPDPKIKFGASNVPIDSWALDDESMTSVVVGIGQQFSRGDTLNLMKQKANQQADASELSAQLRSLDIARNVCRLWLQLGYLNIALDNLNQRLSFQQQLVKNNETNYSLGKKAAQDVLSVELQVTQTQESIDANKQLRAQVVSQLSEWFGVEWMSSSDPSLASNVVQWPRLQPVFEHVKPGDNHALFMQHPLIKQAEKAIAVQETDVSLQQQRYKPQFGVEVSYGHRDGKLMDGSNAPDVASAFVTFDVPIFTDNKQDRSVNAAKYKLGSAKLERDLLLQKINAQVNQQLTILQGLDQRITRYRDQFIPQSHSHLAAVTRAYDSSTASFKDLVSANLDHLSLELNYQKLLTEQNQTKANLAYWFDGFSPAALGDHVNHYQF